MSEVACNLCTRNNIESGKDKLLYEDSFCYIVENGNTCLLINDITMFARKRITLILKEHKGCISNKEQVLVNSTLTNFMSTEFKLNEEIDYFLKITMNTYQDHYHIHAYVLPLTDKGKMWGEETS